MSKLYIYLSKINYLFWSRINNSTTIPIHSLGVFRRIFGFYLLTIATPYFSWIDQVPKAFFDPPILSLANFYDSFPAKPFFTILDIIALVSILCITIGYRTRFFTFTLLIAHLIGTNFQYSFGKLDHIVLLDALLFCMILANWGAPYSIDSKFKKDQPASIELTYSVNKSLSLLAVLIAFGMVTAGAKKAINWIDFDFNTSGFLSWFYSGYYGLERHYLLADVIKIVPYSFFEFADYTAVIFELSGLFALLYSRKTWLLWLLIACTFHLTNTLILNIPFHVHFVIYLVFVDFSNLKNWLEQRQRMVILGIAATLLALYHIILRINGDGVRVIFIEDYPTERVCTLYISVFLWGLAITIFLYNLLYSYKTSKWQKN